jgi:tetratricopeptide (TPR) repeat protein
MAIRISFFLIFYLFQSLHGISQTDSLQNLLKQKISDSTKIDIYKELLYSYSTSAPSKAINYGLEGLVLARRNNDFHSTVSLLNNLGIAYYGLGDYEKTLKYFLEVLELEKQKQNPASLSRAMNNVGIIFDEIGRLDKSTYYYEESLKLKKAINDSLGISNTMSNLGLLYLKRELPEKAIQYFRRCFQIDSEQENISGIYNSLHNIGIYHKDYGDEDSAVYFIQQALLAVPKGEKNYDKAFIIKSLAESYLLASDYRNAENYFKSAIQNAQEVKALEVLKESYKGLSEVYEYNSQFENSLASYKKYKELNDSIFNQDFNSKVSQLEKNF